MSKPKMKWDWATLAPQFFKVALSKLNPYENNARVNGAAIPYVQKSIKTYGMLVPIVIDNKDSLTIVAGHTRLAAMLQLCEEEGRDSSKVKITCILADYLTPAQVRQFRLVDNKTSEFAEWADDLLNSELDELTADGWDASEFGFADGLEEPTDLDGEEDKKPFVAKVTFGNEEKLNEFVSEFSSILEERFSAKISVSGGDL